MLGCGVENPNGKETYRGPHVFHPSICSGVTLRDYPHKLSLRWGDGTSPLLRVRVADLIEWKDDVHPEEGRMELDDIRNVSR